MKWIWFSLLGILMVGGLILFGIHELWVSELPAASRIQSTLIKEGKLRQVDQIDRSTSQIPCYVVQGLDLDGEKEILFTKENGQILFQTKENQLLSQVDLDKSLNEQIPNIHIVRSTYGLYSLSKIPVFQAIVMRDMFGYKQNGSQRVWSLIFQNASTGAVMKQILLQNSAQSMMH